MTILANITSNNPIPEYINAPVDPNEVFKTIVSDITKSLPSSLHISPMNPKP